MAARTWTPEQRQRQRDAIQRWQPWNQSTGPRSTEGKAVAARNAFTGGQRAELRRIVKDMNQALREHREWLGAR